MLARECTGPCATSPGRAQSLDTDRCGTRRRTTRGPCAHARRSRGRMRSGPATRSSSRPRTASTTASSTWKSTSGVDASSTSETQCTFAVARPSCSSTSASSSGSVSPLQSRSFSYGLYSATTKPVPSVAALELGPAEPRVGVRLQRPLADRRAVAVVGEVRRAGLVVDDAAGRRDVALLHRQDDVVLERLGVPLDEQVVRRQPGAADAEPGLADDVLDRVGEAAQPLGLRDRLEVARRRPARPARARRPRGGARPAPCGSGARSPRRRSPGRAGRRASTAAPPCSARSTGPRAVPRRSDHSWSRSVSTNVLDLVEVGAQVGRAQAADVVVGQRLGPAHQRDARDQALQVPGEVPEVGLVEVVDVEDEVAGAVHVGAEVLRVQVALDPHPATCARRPTGRPARACRRRTGRRAAVEGERVGGHRAVLVAEGGGVGLEQARPRPRRGRRAGSRCGRRRSPGDRAPSRRRPDRRPQARAGRRARARRPCHRATMTPADEEAPPCP